MKKVLYAAALLFLVTACTLNRKASPIPGKMICTNASSLISLVRKMK